jgi:hypothetical protein
MPEIFNSAKPKKTSSRKAASHDAVDTAVSTMTTEHRRSKHVDEYSEIMRREQPTSNPFASFAAKPTAFAFDTQQANEQVLLVLRQSIITQIQPILIAIGLALLPMLFNFVGLLDFLPMNFRFIATIGWYLIVTGYSLEVFLLWFYNVYIITDERIIDVDFTSLLFKDVSYAKLDNIEDISAITAGALGSIFDYGTVRIQTAGAQANFDFENVPHPSRVVAFLNELLLEEEEEFLERRAY